MRARPLMLLGTGSHVGKSTLTAALGRILPDDGFLVAPFKAQNMSLNSAATPDGREIGRAQALQADACRTVGCAEMNPVLIKPSTHTSSQVVVLGRVWGQVDASDYYRRRVEELFPIVVSSFHALASRYEIVLLEGAGSPAEINLKARDIANIRMAHAAGAACLLVGDIDRGGVFASLLGTLELLEEEERSLIHAFVINRFRGDLSLLSPGIRMIEDRIGIPCAGVIPYLPSLGLDEEDSMSLEERPAAKCWTRPAAEADGGRPLRVAAIALPHLANFTDFDAMAAEPSVELAFIKTSGEFESADVVIIPGSKQTLDDLEWLRTGGFAGAIQRWRTNRKDSSILVGICGGMQMLGVSVQDSTGLETGVVTCLDALAWLPIRTNLLADKVTRRATGTLAANLFNEIPEGTSIAGYEIHLGKTEYLPGAQPLAIIHRMGTKEVVTDGAIAENGGVFGTYLHGIFDADEFRHAFVRAARSRCGLTAPTTLAFVQAQREQRIDRLAAGVKGALDMDLIYRLLHIRRPNGVQAKLANAAV